MLLPRTDRGLAAPAAVHHLERAIAGGARSVVLCGGAGALVPGLVAGRAVVATGAIRDEGTSFHLAPPPSAIDVDPDVADALVGLLGLAIGATARIHPTQ